DHVFDVLRNWRSDAVRGGGDTGRARMIGRLRAQGADPDTLFTGKGYAPPELTETERRSGSEPVARADLWNLPDWLSEQFQDALGDAAGPTARALCRRAPVTLRVNTSRTTRVAAQRALSEAGIATEPNARAETALTVIGGARRIKASSVYLDGLVELQDASSQAAVARLQGSGRVLDFCAGGGGKSLALAARGWAVTAHDASPRRMEDMTGRARRGGHAITICAPADLPSSGTFDLVLCDAPCSGSGTWRRTPDAKWRLTPGGFQDLTTLQADILDQARRHVAPGGTLAYATCSVLTPENDAQVAAFCARHARWAVAQSEHWAVDETGDGFFLALLTNG
ncbi:MAG: RsmB/NOP family class I SAM-dependent RNA methyltransferase, partial [Pseudomonadota bacterium]